MHPGLLNFSWCSLITKERSKAFEEILKCLAITSTENKTDARVYSTVCERQENGNEMEVLDSEATRPFVRYKVEQNHCDTPG